MITSSDVCRLAGCSYRQLHSWIEREILHPSHPGQGGTGNPHGFTSEDVKVARVFTAWSRAASHTPTPIPPNLEEKVRDALRQGHPEMTVRRRRGGRRNAVALVIDFQLLEESP